MPKGANHGPATGAVSDMRVVELRVHGVSGTPVEDMLGDREPVLVAGDEHGRIYRRRSPVRVRSFPPRTVEAYHWGRYTSGSPLRALWLLLLPFAVVNLAHFALIRPDPLGHTGSSRPERVAERSLRLLGLTLTLTTVVTGCYLAWGVLAAQCSGAACSGLPGWARLLTGQDHGRRILITALLPALLVTMLWWLGRRPPLYPPPGEREPPSNSQDRLGNPTFWLGAYTASIQRAAHVSASCAVIAFLALATITPAPGSSAWVARNALIVLCIVEGLTALGVVVVDRQPRTFLPDPHGRDTLRIPGWLTFVRWSAAGTAVTGVGLAAWLADNGGRPAGTGSFDTVVAAVGAAAGVLVLVLLVACLRMALTRQGRHVCRGDLPGSVPVPPAFRPFYAGLGSVVLAALALTLAFGFSTAAVFGTAELLGKPVRIDATASDAIMIAPGYWTSATVWGVIVSGLVVSALPLSAWVLRRVSLPLLAALLVGVVGGSAGIVATGGTARGLFLLVVSLALLVTGVRVLLRPGRDGFTARVRDDYAPTGMAAMDGVAAPTGSPCAEDERRTALVARAWRLAMARYRYHHVLGAVAVVGGGAVCGWAGLVSWSWFGDVPPGIATLVDPVQNGEPPPDPRLVAVLNALTGIGAWSAASLATGLVAVGVASWRSARIRTTVGILWDLSAFWPRVAHPVCPVPYGGRAVRAMARRACDLANRDLDPEDQVEAPLAHSLPEARPFDRVVLSGHSQGAVIALAACAVVERSAHCPAVAGWLGPEKAQKAWPSMSLVTYGSQLQFIYARMFPSFFGFHQQRQIYAGLDGRWRSLYRWTDPLGGPVLSWPAQDGVDAHSRFGPAVQTWRTMACPTGTCSGTGPALQRLQAPGTDYVHWCIGPDIRLRDPEIVEESAFAPRLRARGHSGYPADPGFDQVVSALAHDRAAFGQGCCQPRDPHPAGARSTVEAAPT